MDPLPIFETQLKTLCLELIVDNFDSKHLKFYSGRWNEITEESRPNFGPFGCQTKRLPCNDDTDYTPLDCNTIELISKRCPKFEMLHYHKDLGIGIQYDHFDVCKVINRSIHRLKHLREISFRDFFVENDTIRIITLNCPHLKELNLRDTDLSDKALNYLYDDESVVKYSLSKLIIDGTVVSVESVAQCLLKLKNLTYFLSDETIQACLRIFEEKSDSLRNFEFPAFRGSLYSENERLLNHEFLEWFTQKFIKVNHVIFVAIFEKSKSIVTRIVRSWRNITHLELFSCDLCRDSFSQLKPAFDCCKETLLNLKLEAFVKVDIPYLGRVLKRLRKISLYNNSYLKTDVIQPFENLKEVEIILISVSFEVGRFKKNLRNMHLNHNSLLSIFKSKYIEKAFIYGQSRFTNRFMLTLLKLDYLRNIKELNLFSCPISIKSLWELFERGIPIKKIVIGFCPFIRVSEINELSVYIKENNYGASISASMEIPYHLKSILKNMELID
ncbi:hypothetical protein Anas_01831 [Armadillidium nasatum]|uniref:Uncharacterized protein n=1 Tax=Armadillidium nasatum TaxID=96803 RepID=A0A5N5T4B9_9CRUS|nr:hypothetical protein Anas_01831 [Armadillidium nasatum]